MKQRIDINQLNELSDKAKERLREWWKPKEGDLFFSKLLTMARTISNNNALIGDSYYDENPEEGDLPILSIGQLIEFLLENSEDKWDEDWGYKFSYGKAGKDYGQVIIGWQINAGDAGFKLCDALWSAVKDILEKEEK